MPCAADGADQEELLFLEDPPQAAPDMMVAQGYHASAVYYVPTAAGHGPMYAYPVQYPDGRIMYHVLPPQVTYNCRPALLHGVNVAEPLLYWNVKYQA